jgi:hypothetical protein
MPIDRTSLRKSSTKVVVRLPITKARINLDQVVKRAHINKEYLILEKDGIPVVGIMDADEMEDYLELQDPKVKRFIASSHKQYVAGKSRPAEDLLARLKRRSRGKLRESPAR